MEFHEEGALVQMRIYEDGDFSSSDEESRTVSSANNNGCPSDVDEDAGGDETLSQCGENFESTEARISGDD